MTDIQVRFVCGCTSTVDVDKVMSPRCLVHNAKASGVVKAPAPSFIGHVRGPNTTPKPLGAIPVSLAKEPLTLKEPT